MRHFTDYLFAFLILATLSISSCGLLEDDDPDGPIGPNNSTLTLETADFSSDLVLEDRNDGVDYLISSQINVDNNLEIRPGVVIEFEDGANMDIRDAGSIMAIGLPGEEIIFTGVLKVKGSWQGIIVESSGIRNQFKHCIIEYGGSESWGNDIQGGLTTWADAALNVDDCTFRNNKNAAVEFYSNDNEIRSFENNRFENNDKSIIISPENVHQLGNTNEFVDLDNVIELQNRAVFSNDLAGESYTWKAQPVSYRVKHQLTVKDNHLSIEAGTTFEFTSNGFIDIADAEASFSAEGTALDPIIFTGVDKVAGAWPGIAFNHTENSKNKLENCIIEYAGGTAGYFDDGAIYMWAKPRINVKSCTFRNIDACIYFNATSGDTNENLTEANNTYQNTGEVLCN